MKIYDLIIIGGGPAGTTAGIYAARQKMNTLLLTKNFGGQVGKKAVDINNYPGFKNISGPDLIRKFNEHLKLNNIEVKIAEVEKVEKEDENFLVFTAKKGKFLSKTLIIASGADPRPLEVPGEKDFIGRGVSYCSICDGPVFQNKEVAVIGGGNAGFESAIFLSNYVKKIYILEYDSRVRADETSQETLRKSGKAEIITSAALKEIKGGNSGRNASHSDTGGFVESIIYEDLKTKERKILKVQGVFVEIGSQPATSFLKGLVDFNERDEIKVEFETYQTKTPGLFAAGDVNVGRFKQIVTACGEGAKAALSAYQYIQLEGIK